MSYLKVIKANQGCILNNKTQKGNYTIAMQTFVLTDNIIEFDYILLVFYKSIQHNGDVSPEKRYRNTQERL
jgi:hypothetical protein